MWITVTVVDQSKTIQSGIQQLVDMVLLVWYLHCMIAISVQTYMYTYISVIQTPKLRVFQATGKTLGGVQGNDSTLLAIFVEIVTFAILMASPHQNVCHSGLRTFQSYG